MYIFKVNGGPYDKNIIPTRAVNRIAKFICFFVVASNAMSLMASEFPEEFSFFKISVVESLDSKSLLIDDDDLKPEPIRNK